jgi:hypothetical protein
MSEEVKTPWYKDPTIDSILAIIVVVLVSFFGVEITEAEIQGTLEQITVAVAAGIALVHQAYRKIAGKTEQ